MTPKRTPKDRPNGLPYLRQWREFKGLEQTEIAARMGLARQQVSRWERGETSPNVWDALDLAGILEVTVEQLANGPGPGGATAAP
jgi:transcriptional regulator with XRE-family HTH domain